MKKEGKEWRKREWKGKMKEMKIFEMRKRRKEKQFLHVHANLRKQETKQT